MCLSGLHRFAIMRRSLFLRIISLGCARRPRSLTLPAPPLVLLPPSGLIRPCRAAAALQIRSAIACALAVSERKFSAAGLCSGTTCTVVIQHGWLLTVATLGDCAVMLDSGSVLQRISAEHRPGVSPPEDQRLLRYPGAHIAKLSPKRIGPAQPGEVGLGQPRLWPAGLSIR